MTQDFEILFSALNMNDKAPILQTTILSTHSYTVKQHWRRQYAPCQMINIQVLICANNLTVEQNLIWRDECEMYYSNTHTHTHIFNMNRSSEVQSKCTLCTAKSCESFWINLSIVFLTQFVWLHAFFHAPVMTLKCFIYTMLSSFIPFITKLGKETISFSEIFSQRKH